MRLAAPTDWPLPFGLGMIGGMACGTPVIAFRRGSVPEIVEGEVSGFVRSSAAPRTGGWRAVIPAICRALGEARRREAECRLTHDDEPTPKAAI